MHDANNMRWLSSLCTAISSVEERVHVSFDKAAEWIQAELTHNHCSPTGFTNCSWISSNLAVACLFPYNNAA